MKNVKKVNRSDRRIKKYIRQSILGEKKNETEQRTQRNV